MDLSKLLSERTAYMRASEIRELLKWATADVISFGGGMPDPSTFPLEEIARISSYVLETYGGQGAPVRTDRGRPGASGRARQVRDQQRHKSYGG
jgi:hypothetical protein